MMFDSIISIITMIAAVAVLVLYIIFKKKKGKEDWVYVVSFITIFISGTVIYSLGLWYKNDTDATFSQLHIIGMAICYGLKSFVGDFNASALSKLAGENHIFAVAAFINYAAAIILTCLIAIKLFGQEIINELHVFRNSFCSKYIVIGASGQAEVFLKNLNYRKRNLTTVVLEAKYKDTKKDLMSMGFAVVVIGNNKEKQSKRKKETNDKNDITKTEVYKETYKALKKAGFHRCKRVGWLKHILKAIIFWSCKYETQIISMSEDDELNLLVAKIVTDYIKRIVEPTKNEKGRVNDLTREQEIKLSALKVSAHIMYSTFDRTEHFAFAEYALGRVKFFNPYEIRARKFMLEYPITSLIPEAWINTENARLHNASDKGYNRPYRIGNFFVGYGNTNQHILKKSICNYQILGTDYNALIIAKNAKELEKQFRNSAPGLFNKTNEKGEITAFGSELKHNPEKFNPDRSLYYPNHEENYNIAFTDLNVLSSDFYNRVIEEIEGIDGKPGYDFALIVISLDPDKFSIETALELRQKLYERNLLKGKVDDRVYDRVRIFVKVSKYSVLTSKEWLNDPNDIDSEISVFGTSDEFLNEDYIVEEYLDSIAKNIANDYWKHASTETQKTSIVTKWDALTEFKRDSNRYATMSIRMKLNLLGFDLKKGADKKDKETIKARYNAAYGKKQRDEEVNGTFVDFVERDNGGKILDNARNNLARLEHQRWNSLHLVSGWTKLEKAEVTDSVRQDEKAKQHACITTFEGLTDLRVFQAKKALEKAKTSGKKLSESEALSDADTVCYDFNLMDNLFDILEGLNYCVTMRE